MVKRSIYICRKVQNTDDLNAWAKSQGFTSCQIDMHVTVAFDYKKHDWSELPLEGPRYLDVYDTEERSVEMFRNGAVVLEIYAMELHARWAELLQSGLNWKHHNYRPHITVTYNMPDGMDLSKIEPYRGVIKLGPEVTSEVVFKAREQLEENDL